MASETSYAKPMRSQFKPENQAEAGKLETSRDSPGIRVQVIGVQVENGSGGDGRPVHSRLDLVWLRAAVGFYEPTLD